MIIPADCEECGVCCFSDSQSFVPVQLEDLNRLGLAASSLLTHREGTQSYMRMAKGACIALERANGRFRCSIYSTRPEICREFQQGSPECRIELIRIRRGT